MDLHIANAKVSKFSSQVYMYINIISKENVFTYSWLIYQILISSIYYFGEFFTTNF